MKKLLIMIIVVSAIVTACSSNDNNVGDHTDNTNQPGTIMDMEDKAQKEDPNRVIDSEVMDIVIGMEAPDFTLVNLDGERVSLSDYRGKIVLVNFWASWCHWCDVEMPDLNNLDIENEDVVVLGVNVMEDEETVRNYLEEGGYEFEVVFDTEGEIASNYLVDGLPNSYFIDKEGVLQLRFPGMMAAEQMSEVVNAIREYHEENN